MKKAFVFPGQGAQFVGMGKDLYENSPEAKELFESDYLRAQISRFGGNISRTAEFIGMERSALHRKLRALNLRSTKEGEGA